MNINVTRIETRPEFIYIVEIDGKRTMITKWLQLMTFWRFKRKIAKDLEIILDDMKQTQWEKDLREILERCIHIPDRRLEPRE